MAEKEILTTAAASVASTMASDLANITEIFPKIFYTNDYNLCDENIIRAKNIKFIIMVDRIYWENKENINPSGECDKVFDESDVDTNEFGSDVEILNVTFGNPGKPSGEPLSTCDQVARFLVQAKTTCQSSLIIDCNKDVQRCITIVIAYLIYHETQSFFKAFAMLSKYFSKLNLNQYYADILINYERVILAKLKQMNQNSIKIIKNVENESNDTAGFHPKYDPFHGKDYKEKVAMVKHLNAGKPMETFDSEYEQEKNDYDLEHPSTGGAGEWNNSVHTDLLDEFFEEEYTNELD